MDRLVFVLAAPMPKRVTHCAICFRTFERRASRPTSAVYVNAGPIAQSHAVHTQPNNWRNSSVSSNGVPIHCLGIGEKLMICFTA